MANYTTIFDKMFYVSLFSELKIVTIMLNTRFHLVCTQNLSSFELFRDGRSYCINQNIRQDYIYVIYVINKTGTFLQVWYRLILSI